MQLGADGSLAQYLLQRSSAVVFRRSRGCLCAAAIHSVLLRHDASEPLGVGFAPTTTPASSAPTDTSHALEIDGPLSPHAEKVSAPRAATNQQTTREPRDRASQPAGASEFGAARWKSKQPVDSCARSRVELRLSLLAENIRNHVELLDDILQQPSDRVVQHVQAWILDEGNLRDVVDPPPTACGGLVVEVHAP